MTDGYDYDFMVADYDNDILYIVRGSKQYDYVLSIEEELFEGGKANGVEHRTIGHPEDAEDLQDEWTDDDALTRGTVTYKDGHTYSYYHHDDRNPFDYDEY